MLDKKGGGWYSMSVPETAGISSFWADISPAEDKHTDISAMSLSLDKDFFFMEVKPNNAE